MIFAALGALFGFVAGLFGTSGGIVAVPVLVIFFSMVQQGAEGTALVMIVPNLALGFWRYAREGDINRRLALILGISAIPLSIVRGAARGPAAARRAAPCIWHLRRRRRGVHGFPRVRPGER